MCGRSNQLRRPMHKRTRRGAQKSRSHFLSQFFTLTRPHTLQVDALSNKTFMVFEGNNYSYKQMDDKANQVGLLCAHTRHANTRKLTHAVRMHASGRSLGPDAARHQGGRRGGSLYGE